MYLALTHLPKDNSKQKPSWYQSKVSPNDSLAVMVKLLGKELEQLPVVEDGDGDKNSKEGQKVIKQSSIMWFLKQNACRLGNTLKDMEVNHLRYLTSNATTAKNSTRVIDLLRTIVKKRTPLIAIVDDFTGALITTFSVSSLKVLLERSLCPCSQWLIPPFAINNY